jgi:DNA polymerase III sliding clamp (beta) subunit (PCNA family)
MLIKKSQLQEALAIVKPGLAGKEQVEQSTSFAFIGGRVVTYNDDISISHPVEGLEIEGAIESDKLYQFLTKVKQEEIDLEIKGTEIIITAGKAKAGLVLQQEIKLPLDSELAKKGKFKPLPEEFLKYVAFCLPSIGTVSIKPMLQCVHVNKNGTIEASDGYRITHCELAEGGEMPVETFLIPGKACPNMLKLQPTLIAEGNGWIHFKNPDKTIFSCRTFEGKYPLTDKYLQIEGDEVTFPKTISEVLERASIFSGPETNEKVRICLENKRVQVSSTSNLGWFEETVNAGFKGDKIQFLVNANLLKGIIKETQTGIVNNGKIVFKGEGWLFMAILQADESK